MGERNRLDGAQWHQYAACYYRAEFCVEQGVQGSRVHHSRSAGILQRPCLLQLVLDGQPGWMGRPFARKLHEKTGSTSEKDIGKTKSIGNDADPSCIHRTRATILHQKVSECPVEEN